MGKEVLCAARVDGRAARSKAHLDSTALRLSGGHRLVVPLVELSKVVVAGDTLIVASRQGVVELELGAGVAQRWAQAIHSPKSRLEKIGVRRSERVCIRGVSDEAFIDELRDVLTIAPATSLRGTFDSIFQGLNDPNDLVEISRCKSHLRPAGALWVVHPKGKGSPVGESAVRAAIAAAGLFEAKVVALSPTHTATKAAIRLKDRSTM